MQIFHERCSGELIGLIERIQIEANIEEICLCRTTVIIEAGRSLSEVSLSLLPLIRKLKHGYEKPPIIFLNKREIRKM